MWASNFVRWNSRTAWKIHRTFMLISSSVIHLIQSVNAKPSKRQDCSKSCDILLPVLHGELNTCKQITKQPQWRQLLSHHLWSGSPVDNSPKTRCLLWTSRLAELLHETEIQYGQPTLLHSSIRKMKKHRRPGPPSRQRFEPLNAGTQSQHTESCTCILQQREHQRIFTYSGAVFPFFWKGPPQYHSVHSMYQCQCTPTKLACMQATRTGACPSTYLFPTGWSKLSWSQHTFNLQVPAGNFPDAVSQHESCSVSQFGALLATTVSVCWLGEKANKVTADLRF